MCVLYHFPDTAKQYSIDTIFVLPLSLLSNIFKETLGSNEISLLKLFFIFFFFVLRSIATQKPENTYLCMR